MKYVAIANLKGGVGKSTTTMMLAESLAVFHNLAVLVIDLDPQANSSFMFLSRAGAEKQEKAGHTFMHFLESLETNSRKNLSRFVHSNASDIEALARPKGRGRVDLIPSSPKMWFSEARFECAAYQNRKQPDSVLAEATRLYLKRIQASYDVVLIDCPPGFSTLARAGIRISDIVVSPTISDDISARSLKDFIETGLQELGVAKPHYVIVTRHVQHIVNEIMLDRLRREYTVIGSPIKYSIDIIRACQRIRHDSFRSFREKYGAQHASVKELGAAFSKVLKLHNRVAA